MSEIASERAWLVVRTRDDRLSFRLEMRVVAIALLLVLVIAAAGTIGLMTGDYPLSLGDVTGALVGHGSPDASFVVETLRLPRVLSAILVGIAFGISGAIFQSVTRNPLGSPDIVGFSNGAATGALVLILVVHGTGNQVAGAAAFGGLATAAVVYALAWQGGVHGYRLILVGIAVAALLQAANAYLLTRAELFDAQAAGVWLVGSLTSCRLSDVWMLSVTLSALVPAALLLGRRLRLLELGDDTASSLGTPLERSRLGLVALAAALAAVATAAAGPIAFVALMSPQIARRLTRAGGPVLLTSALTGAALLLVADVAAQRLFPTELPVGVVTGAVGGIYLSALLSRRWRAGAA